MNYRIATMNDIPTLIELRKKQLIDEGQSPNISIDEELQKYFEKHLDDGTLVEWLAEDSGLIVGSSAIMYLDFPPSFTNKSGINITNMYTAPEYRGRGIALQLLEKVVEDAKNRSVSEILLSASEMGMLVYQRFGFKKANEWMQLKI